MKCPARKPSPQKLLINTCLVHWIAQHGRKKLEAQLAAEYREGNLEARRVGRDLAAIDQEGWPQW